MLLLYIVSFKEFGSLVCLWHDVKLRKTQLEVRSLTATWSRDLWVHRVVVFLEMCQIVGWTAMANLAALRAAVFSLSAKNLRGGGWNQPPPAGARVKTTTRLVCGSESHAALWGTFSIAVTVLLLWKPLSILRSDLILCRSLYGTWLGDFFWNYCSNHHSVSGHSNPNLSFRCTGECLNADTLRSWQRATISCSRAEQPEIKQQEQRISTFLWTRSRYFYDPW